MQPEDHISLNSDPNCKLPLETPSRCYLLRTAPSRDKAACSSSTVRSGASISTEQTSWEEGLGDLS